jgi:hypothetical protein
MLFHGLRNDICTVLISFGTHYHHRMLSASVLVWIGFANISVFSVYLQLFDSLC